MTPIILSTPGDVSSALWAYRAIYQQTEDTLHSAQFSGDVVSLTQSGGMSLMLRPLFSALNAAAADTQLSAAATDAVTQVKSLDPYAGKR